MWFKRWQLYGVLSLLLSSSESSTHLLVRWQTNAHIRDMRQLKKLSRIFGFNRTLLTLKSLCLVIL